MKLHKLYLKPVDRPIEGVIKADDDKSLYNELEEYVLTNEVEKRLDLFLQAYNQYENANGVWISGFFGSGKSHLLKMLALILENRTIENQNALALFLPKCGDNRLLEADLKKATSIPSKSILFNIDQKADVISKHQSDALLAVFAKVLDEECGYYGKLGYIAQFERDLDNRELYQTFKQYYQHVANKPWERGREEVLLETINIANAYEQTTGEPASIAMGILNKYRDQYSLSIEDFAEQVKAYIDKHPANFRLNFFVDEVGQYIADNTKLMTNLQTIAESLATKCHGQAWIIVTAQEEMSGVVGEMTKQQGNDFTKIQARFANRLKLTSQDVAEVIQKRLLSKTATAEEQLANIYNAEFNNFKTLFDFADGSVSYLNFQDKEHFIQSYPFIPYQFSLFQSAIQNLSQHNAFEGRHSSVGERSMLGVFQQVAIKTSDAELGQLATFDLMFEGIRTTLKSQIQKAVIHAENNLQNPFALKLLKALFLIKYIKEFKATLRNICVLMTDSFSANLPQLKQDVEQALNLLEQQTYIQRNGAHYEYLTNEEKDVEEEIKNTDVETTDVIDDMAKIIFDNIIKHRKIHLKKHQRHYSYTRKIDDKVQSREYELSINIITPFHEQSGRFSVLHGLSMAHDEVMVLMPEDDRLIRDLLNYRKTYKYIGQNIRTTQRDSIRRILAAKATQNNERYKAIQQHIKQLLSSAKILVLGTELDIASTDPQTRIIHGFEELVNRVYSNLSMLQGANYSEHHVASYLNNAQKSLLGNDASVMAEPEQELFAYVNRNKNGGIRTTLKNLLEKFESKPYGWPYAAILCTLAMLCARGKIEVRSNGNSLDDKELEAALLNTRTQANIVLEPQIEFSVAEVRILKELYEDLFDAPPKANEAKALGKETAVAFQQLINEINPLITQVENYPFLSALIPACKTLQTFMGKPYTWYLKALAQEEDTLLDLKEELLDPIRKLMSGSQKVIYQQARLYMQEQRSNFSYIETDTHKLQILLDDPKCYQGNKLQIIKTQHEILQKQVEQTLKQEKIIAIARLTTMKERLQSMDDFQRLTIDQQIQVTQPFEQFINNTQDEKLIAVIRDALHRFEENDYQKLLTNMVTLAQATQKYAPTGSDGSKKATPSKKISDTKIQYVSSKQIAIHFPKAWLENEEDVEQYLQQMREVLLQEIKQGKRIQI